jgi:hypothetical protein
LERDFEFKTIVGFDPEEFGGKVQKLKNALESYRLRLMNRFRYH